MDKNIVAVGMKIRELLYISGKEGYYEHFPLADVKAHFSAYIKKIRNEPVIVTKNGKPIAILMGISDKDDLDYVAQIN